ncbi:MAG TPA: NUDIX domain-containing protein, partial [Parapedobacter sp.]|nr:NUDIX domain-containing protein [Parapedobacter sp.]
FTQLAKELLDDTRPGLYNQAIMEFGALQCKPKNPDCENCVLRLDCRALKEGRIGQLPVKLKGKASRNRYFNYFVVEDGDRILMNKRNRGDIWESLYELPLIETARHMELHELMVEESVVAHFGPEASLRLLGSPVKHVLSHQNLFAQFVTVDQHAGTVNKKIGWDYVLIKDLGTLAKPKLIYSFLKGLYGLPKNT